MSSAESVPEDRALTPEDWSTEPEQRYGAAQAALAEHHGVEIESRVADTSAGPVHYLEAGDPDGEPVLLLHGVSTTGATWLPLAPALADEYRLIMPDRPGMGLSAKPSYRGRNLRSFMVSYLLELLDDLEIDRPHVVGNSLGGKQAFLVAIDHDRVDRLCLVGGPGGVTRKFPILARLLTMKGVNRLLFWLTYRGDAVETARELMNRTNVVDGSTISEEFYEVLGTNSELPGRNESLRSLNTEQGSFGRMHPLFDLRDEISEIERPTCFVWGTDDSYFDPEYGRSIAERMTVAEFHVLPDHGHTPWMEPGEETETRVRAFLDGDGE